MTLATAINKTGGSVRNLNWTGQRLLRIRRVHALNTSFTTQITLSRGAAITRSIDLHQVVLSRHGGTHNALKLIKWHLEACN